MIMGSRKFGGVDCEIRVSPQFDKFNITYLLGFALSLDSTLSPFVFLKWILDFRIVLIGTR